MCKYRQFRTDPWNNTLKRTKGKKGFEYQGFVGKHIDWCRGQLRPIFEKLLTDSHGADGTLKGSKKTTGLICSCASTKRSSLNITVNYNTKLSQIGGFQSTIDTENGLGIGLFAVLWMHNQKISSSPLPKTLIKLQMSLGYSYLHL